MRCDIRRPCRRCSCAIRNMGETGIAMMAVSAIDNALWDLRARLADLPLVSLLGQVRSAIPVYGSGGLHDLL